MEEEIGGQGREKEKKIGHGRKEEKERNGGEEKYREEMRRKREMKSGGKRWGREGEKTRARRKGTRCQRSTKDLPIFSPQRRCSAIREKPKFGAHILSGLLPPE